jgi:glutaredoxin-like protein DUF836
MSDSHRVIMYSRGACHLCDEARDAILAERGRGTSFEFVETTIDGDDGLEGEFGLRVPVVLIDGREEFEIAVEPARLRRLLRRSEGL